MKIIVQKYGGSSLATGQHIKVVAEKIAASNQEDNGIVVVASAMGGSTDALLDLAAEVSADPGKRELGLLLSTGEVVCASLLALALQQLGHKAITLTGAQSGIVVDGKHDNARIENIDPAAVRSLLEKGYIVVVTGYQGQLGEDVAVLGRGGSDASAVALAASLRAEQCCIYTDVPGVLTADPRLVPSASRLETLSYEEMLALSGGGAQVMMGRSIEIARKYGLDIVVQSTFEDAPGTLITNEENLVEKREITGISLQKSLAKITIQSEACNYLIINNILRVIGKYEIDIVHLNRYHNREENRLSLGLIVREKDVERLENILKNYLAPAQQLSYNVQRGLAQLTVVGYGILQNYAVAALAHDCLAHYNIDVILSGKSEIKLILVIEEKDAQTAMARLHDEFQLSAISQPRHSEQIYAASSGVYLQGRG